MVLTSGFPVKICEKVLKNYSLCVSSFDKIFGTQELWLSYQNPPTKGKGEGRGGGGSRGHKIFLKHEEVSVSFTSHTGKGAELALAYCGVICTTPQAVKLPQYV